MPLVDIIGYAESIVKPDYRGHPLRKGAYPDRIGWDTERLIMGWHVLGEYPVDLVELKRPTEDTIWKSWRRHTYQPITKGPINRAIVSEQRTFLESNYRINYAEGDTDTEAYINQEIFEGERLVTWLHDLPHRVSKYDANAVIVPMPTRFDTTENSVGFKVDVQFSIIDSSQILDRNETVISWKAYETVPIQDGNATIQGDVYWIIDDSNYYRYEQINANRDFALIGPNEINGVPVWYPHNTGAPLFQVLGGNAYKVEDSVLYRSTLEGYAPFANDAILAYSDFKVTETLNAYPTRIEKPRDCDHVTDAGKCDSGTWVLFDGGVSGACSKCGGTGKRRSVGPTNAIEREMPVGTGPLAEAMAAGLNVPELEYVQPPVESLEFTKKAWIDRLEMAKEAINLRHIQQAQSGTAKEMDREEEHAQIQNVASWWQGVVMENVIFMVVKLRNPLTFQNLKPQVAVATDFKLKTSADLLEELKNLKETDPPLSVYLAKVREYAQRSYANDSLTRLKIELSMSLDYLHMRNPEFQNLMLSNGTAEERDLVLSAYICQIIEKIIEKNPESVKWDSLRWMVEVNKELEEILKEREEREPEPEPQPQPIIPVPNAPAA